MLIMTKKHNPGPCDEDKCKMPMELNGLRFVCDDHHTLEMHCDEFPVYYAAPRLLLAVEQLLMMRENSAIIDADWDAVIDAVHESKGE